MFNKNINIQAADLNKNSVITIEHVFVQYRVPHEKIGTLREFIIRSLQGKVRYNTFNAIHDVSFDVQSGEVFGLIGDNGAGKSTLLKVVARVLRPIQGRVVVRGKVAPLLELGAGFHPELTGRENVYLNGAILGYNRKELDIIFPEIVQFSELEDFIDAPIRTYSSGMYARLGFSVATAFQPEVLIIDEILGVGDESFQQKCALRIEKFRENGTSILLVSHSLNKIEEMCQRVAWLDHGQLKAIGQPKEVIKEYRERNNK